MKLFWRYHEKKRIIGFVSFVLCFAMVLPLFVLTACSSSAVNSVILDKDELTITDLDQAQLTAKVLPESAENKSVFWDTENPDVAVVLNGTVIPKSVGETVITVTTEDGNKTDSCIVRVTEFQGMRLNFDETEITVGRRKTLYATVRPASDVTYVSSDPEVAKVTEEGHIIALKPGTATVTASASPNGKDTILSCKVTVKDALPIIPMSDSDAVEVTGGKIKGYYSDESKELEVYKGIPYAHAERWKAPTDPESWSGVRDCTKYGPACWQAEPSSMETSLIPEGDINLEGGMSEDCQNLNIWTKSAGKENAKRPVMVYIHGGAWMALSNSPELFSGEYLARQDVVYVSINYRLGIYGFFGAGILADENEEGLTGNYGLMDCVKALEWIRENIAKFGGDPNNVTIMGGSAGAELVSQLVVSPKAGGAGLVHHAFSMSLPLISWDTKSISDKSKQAGNDFLEKYGGLETLRSLSDEEFYRVTSAGLWEALAFGAMSLGCSIDGVYVMDNFKNCLEKGMGKDVDLVVGMVWDKNNPVMALDSPVGFDTQWLMGANNRYEGATDGELLQVYNIMTAKARQKGGAANTYILEFGHPQPAHVKLGAYHGGDAAYFLHNLADYRDGFWSIEDEYIADLASSYLINFMRTGDPNGALIGSEESGETMLPIWEKSEGEYKFFRIEVMHSGMIVPNASHVEVMRQFEESGQIVHFG